MDFNKRKPILHAATFLFYRYGVGVKEGSYPDIYHNPLEDINAVEIAHTALKKRGVYEKISGVLGYLLNSAKGAAGAVVGAVDYGYYLTVSRIIAFFIFYLGIVSLGQTSLMKVLWVNFFGAILLWYAVPLFYQLEAWRAFLVEQLLSMIMIAAKCATYLIVTALIAIAARVFVRYCLIFRVYKDEHNREVMLTMICRFRWGFFPSIVRIYREATYDENQLWSERGDPHNLVYEVDGGRTIRRGIHNFLIVEEEYPFQKLSCERSRTLFEWMSYEVTHWKNVIDITYLSLLR